MAIVKADETYVIGYGETLKLEHLGLWVYGQYP